MFPTTVGRDGTRDALVSTFVATMFYIAAFDSFFSLFNCERDPTPQLEFMSGEEGVEEPLLGAQDE